MKDAQKKVNETQANLRVAQAHVSRPAKRGAQLKRRQMGRC